jgi:hypothetical protein
MNKKILEINYFSLIIIITFVLILQTFFLIPVFSMERESTPARWIKCGEDNLGVVKGVGGVDYICSLKDGDYLWVAGHEKVTNKEQSLMDIVTQFIWKIFSYL